MQHWLRRGAIALGTLFALALAHPSLAADTASAAADYSKPSSWLCRPGNETICTADLDALLVKPDGTRTKQPFVAAASPPTDCFYVYPTVSKEPTVYADMAASPEIQEVARGQAGRLASRCRLFVPIYRQRTLAGIADTSANGTWDWSGPLADVTAAWRWYLAHDNHGRGVVLIGHSQGTLLLQRMIAQEIDGKPAQAQLVAAFLSGDQGLGVPPGKTVGGTFKHIPICTAAEQIGCAYAWGSYLVGDNPPDRFFGVNPGNGLVAACGNPAAPGGGEGRLEAYFRRPPEAPDSDPPWVEAVGQLSASCVADAQGAVLRITVLPTRFAELLTTKLRGATIGPRWGLHRFDVNFTLGNILDLIDLETASWRKRGL